MIFTRTSRGLSNQYLFWGVDSVVFVEGGEDTLSINQVIAGLSGSQSIDVLFWQGIFLTYLTGKKFKFLPVGSKGTIKYIANEIKAGNITHVYVAMDRDHDCFIGSLIEAPGVFYTYGYSWENDVFNKTVIEDLFHSMCPISLNGINYTKEIESLINDFSRDIRWAVYADILLACNGSSLFPRRQRPESLLQSDANGKPIINRQKILTLVKKAKSKSTSKIVLRKRITFSPCVDCYGHLMALYFYRSLVYLLKKYAKVPDLPKHYAYTSAINQFCMDLTKPPLSIHNKHYQDQFAILP